MKKIWNVSNLLCERRKHKRRGKKKSKNFRHVFELKDMQTRVQKYFFERSYLSSHQISSLFSNIVSKISTFTLRCREMNWSIFSEKRHVFFWKLRALDISRVVISRFIFSHYFSSRRIFFLQILKYFRAGYLEKFAWNILFRKNVKVKNSISFQLSKQDNLNCVVQDLWTRVNVSSDANFVGLKFHLWFLSARGKNLIFNLKVTFGSLLMLVCLVELC